MEYELSDIVIRVVDTCNIILDLIVRHNDNGLRKIEYLTPEYETKTTGDRHLSKKDIAFSINETIEHVYKETGKMIIVSDDTLSKLMDKYDGFWVWE